MKKYLFAEQKDYIGPARARVESQWDGPDWYGKDKDGLVIEDDEAKDKKTMK